MMHHVWRLTEGGDDNLALACTEDSLVLGRTALIERCAHGFVVRRQDELERLLSCAYHERIEVDQLMPRLAAIAAALNANDQALARIAAVHLQIPDLPGLTARDRMEAEDRLIKSGDWNPALHPRAGMPPNPGWFAPTGGAAGETVPTRTAQNETPNQTSDVSPDFKDDWVRFARPAKRIDELSDFAEWLANATQQDEQAIRAEIKRYFEDVGWHAAAHDLNSKLSVVLRTDVTPNIRQRVLDAIDPYTRIDPAEYVGTRDFLNAAVLAGSGLLVAADAPSPVWTLGWARRGQIINQRYGDPTFPANYPVIDKIPEGVATSVKSIDLSAATYQQEASLTYRLNKYVQDVQEFDGADWGNQNVRDTDIKARSVELIIPKGSMTDVRRVVIEKIRARAKRSNRPVNIIITEL